MSEVIPAITAVAAIGILWFLFAPTQGNNTGQTAASSGAGPIPVGKGDGTGDDGGGGGKSE